MDSGANVKGSAKTESRKDTADPKTNHSDSGSALSFQDYKNPIFGNAEHYEEVDPVIVPETASPDVNATWVEVYRAVKPVEREQGHPRLQTFAINTSPEGVQSKSSYK